MIFCITKTSIMSTSTKEKLIETLCGKETQNMFYMISAKLSASGYRCKKPKPFGYFLFMVYPPKGSEKAKLGYKVHVGVYPATNYTCCILKEKRFTYEISLRDKK